MPIVEFLSYRLKPEAADEFHRIMEEVSVPLHRAHGLDVVTHGPSLEDVGDYILIRSFASRTARQEGLQAFYASNAWREGPRSAIVEAIETAVTVVLDLNAAAVEALRSGHAS